MLQHNRFWQFPDTSERMVLLACLFLAFAWCWVEFHWPFSLRQPIVIVELGDPMDVQPGDFWDGDERLLVDMMLDTSGIQADATGDYPVTAFYRRRQAVVTVRIVDTTPPDVTLTSQELTAIAGQSLDATRLIKSIQDQSATTVSWDPEQAVATLRLTSPGDQERILFVRDSQGNTTASPILIHVVAKDRSTPVHGEASAIALTGAGDAEPVLNAVLDYLGGWTDRMGIVYRDLESGEGFVINPDTQYRSASTAKVFVNMALYDAVADGRLRLDQTVTYTQGDYESGTGILQGMNLKKPYPLSTLADYAMLHSDNIAFNMIRRVVGDEECFDYYESVIGHGTDRSTTSMSAADGAALMTELYTRDLPTFQHMLGTMRRTDFTNMIPRDLPAGIVASKVGFFDLYNHDIGIVYASDSPYVLAVFTEGLAYAQDVVADVSRIIYENR